MKIIHVLKWIYQNVSSWFKFLIVFFDLLDLTVLFASPESQLDMEVTTETSSEWAMQGVL